MRFYLKSTIVPYIRPILDNFVAAVSVFFGTSKVRFYDLLSHKSIIKMLIFLSVDFNPPILVNLVCKEERLFC